jgi:hypothetical protein
LVFCLWKIFCPSVLVRRQLTTTGPIDLIESQWRTTSR